MTIALLLLAGLALLLVAGELLVRGAVLVALRLGVSPLMIGLTVVGFGTSMPELVTSLQAAFAGTPGIAIGNVVGSNIANILLILGLAAIVSPIPCPVHSLIRDGGVMLAAALALLALTAGGAIGRADGTLLVLGLVAYLLVVWRQEHRRGRDGVAPDTVGAVSGLPAEAPVPGVMAVMREIGLLAAGLAGLVLGARLLVDGAVDLAAAAGVSDTVVGLTIVAVGTSLPELVTSVVAAIRRQSDIAFGNVIGSNIFNALGIAGTTAIAMPVAVPPEIVRFDLPVMIGATLLLTVFAATGARLTRGEGVVLLAGYALYIGVLL